MYLYSHSPQLLKMSLFLIFFKTGDSLQMLTGLFSRMFPTFIGIKTHVSMSPFGSMPQWRRPAPHPPMNSVRDFVLPLSISVAALFVKWVATTRPRANL